MTAPTPAIPTFTDGAAVAQASLSALSSAAANLYSLTQGGFRLAKPLALVARDVTPAAISWLTTGGTLMPWDDVAVNTDNMFAPSAPAVLTVNTAGWYRLAAQVHFDNRPYSNRTCRILANGTDPIANAVASDMPPTLSSANSSTGTAASVGAEGTVGICETTLACPAGTTLYVWAVQNVGATLPNQITYSGSFFFAEWLAPL